MDEIKIKCKNEIRSFFGLTLINIVVAALIMALGIGFGITQLLAVINSGEILLTPLFLIGAGFTAVIAGVYWLTKTAEILDGIDQINSTYEQLPQHPNQDQVTNVFVEMLAHYRKNKPLIGTMTSLGRISGVIFIIVGCLSLIYAGYTLLVSGIVIEGLSQLAGGIIAACVGIGSFLIAKYFKSYAGVWETRLQMEPTIQDALKKQLEGN